ncbi:MAG: hypothetical protein Tsb0020_54130 [Haliangiales bacterium]
MNRCLSSSRLLSSRLAPLLSVLVLVLVMALSACGRPKEEDCTKAVANIRNLYDTAGTNYGVSPRAAVRSCRGSATRESVQCMIAAKSVEELESCKGDFVDSLRGAMGDEAGGDEAGGDEAGGDEAGGDEAGQETE